MKGAANSFMLFAAAFVFHRPDTADLQMLTPLYREGIIGLQKLISE
ncbi:MULTISPECIES: hypothetical protein [Bacillus]|nr:MULTISPECIES: hypothetical protein [Bacillus]ARW33582.1 hypothetical protein S101441_04063 [Bacillus subtilis subsp. subtilis]ASB71867.1 hypothetical protein S100333_04004 [Bacillus subtilis subsp. subtilis]MCM3333148.1 hypothetical protein [Bacillus subtilis]MCR8903918.1 hypothetical protein [Bacillus subtilis]MEC0287605.1 hypothetical protein [Bacillus subtilis]